MKPIYRWCYTMRVWLLQGPAPIRFPCIIWKTGSRWEDPRGTWISETIDLHGIYPLLTVIT